MNRDEFRNEFDLLYNNIASNAAPPVDDYEKSAFLTQAQKDIVTELYSGRNPEGLAFESSEESRTYLQNLLSVCTVTSGFNSIKYPEDYWFTVYEEVKFADSSNCMASKSPSVVPVKLDSLYRIVNNPFRGPSEKRVLRVGDSAESSHISKLDISEYSLVYIRRPKPIILSDLGEGLSIDNETGAHDCELNTSLHLPILKRAVELAKAAYIGKQ